MTAYVTQIAKVTVIQERTMTTKSKSAHRNAESDTHDLTTPRFEILKRKSFGIK